METPGLGGSVSSSLSNLIVPKTVHSILTACAVHQPLLPTRKPNPRDWRLIKLAENGQRRGPQLVGQSRVAPAADQIRWLQAFPSTASL